MTPAPQRWDIFCKIVDNFGDIGVCWRLSQQLALEYGLQVRLLIDDLTIAQKIIPGLEVSAAYQTINGVEICAYQQPEITPADVVIETFSCGLPDSYLAQMQSQVWINLEYLSAEGWVSDFHGKPSKHPTLPLTKHYFFPGFSEATGGLIRERTLMLQREAYLNSPALQAAFWQALGLTDLEPDALKISLFHYPQANLPSLFAALEQSDLAVQVFVPAHHNAFAENKLFASYAWDKANRLLTKSNIGIHLIPFLSQSDYDRLLWSCDLNFVRGEDSWIRAIWAGKPFIWQPYIQADHVHIDKLKAFLNIYKHTATPALATILQDAHLAWSDTSASQTKPWLALLAQLPQIHNYAEQQCYALAAQADLATKLVIFSEKLSKTRV